MLLLVDGLPVVWRDAVYAALLGDAFGVPFEFKAGVDVPAMHSLSLVMPEDYPKSHPGVPYGTWSDDGSLLLALLAALTEREGRFDPELTRSFFVDWYEAGRFQAGGVVFDCGLQTSQALEAASAGLVSGDSVFCGNGSLMRVLPAACLPDAFGLPQEEALRAAVAQSVLTHPQWLAQACCALYVELLWLVQDAQRVSRELVSYAAARLIRRNVLAAEVAHAVQDVLRAGPSQLPVNSGFVVNSFWCAVWAAERAGSVSQAVKLVVSHGGDADTVACLAAPLASLSYGLDPLAREWLSQLRMPQQL